MLSIGLIGCGGWASSMHVPALVKLQSFGLIRVAAVCDINPELAQKAAEKLGGCDCFNSAEEMLNSDQTFDAISILSPVHITESLIEVAAKSRLPFITEKPPVSTAAKQRELITLVADLPHVVAYNRRFAPYMKIAHDWMANESLQSVSASFSRHRRRDKPFSNTFVHGLDALLSFTGRVDSLQAMITEKDDVINLSMQVWSKENILGHLLVTPNAGVGLEHYQVRSATRYVDIAFPQFGMYDLPGSVSCFENNVCVSTTSAVDLDIAKDDMAELGGIINEYKHLVEVVSGGVSSRSTLSKTLQTQEIREFLDQQDLGACELSLAD